MNYIKVIVTAAVCGFLFQLAACTMPQDPANAESTYPYENGSSILSGEAGLRLAGLDYSVGDLSDPVNIAKLARADLLIVQPWQFWNSSNDLELLRAANPNIRILAYFRTKCIREAWSQSPETGTNYTHDLYQAGLPYLAHTTTGDTLSDWPGTWFVDYTNPAARKAQLDVFKRYQATSANKFDGVFWDYFSPRLWISPAVTNMTGEPDIDGDGVPHWEDEDELQAFVDAQDDFVDEMRAAMGPNFIQIANGTRALQDSTFAAKFDGMFYESFPNQGFGGAPGFRMALDPAVPNNLWAARTWPRTRNGGPWLILSNMYRAGTYMDDTGEYQVIDADDLTRAVALLTDATAITYEGFGVRDAGIPVIEYNLGEPLGATTLTGDTYTREFENGRIDLFMGPGDYPVPFEFTVTEDGRVLHDLDLPTIDR